MAITKIICSASAIYDLTLKTLDPEYNGATFNPDVTVYYMGNMGVQDDIVKHKSNDFM